MTTRLVFGADPLVAGWVARRIRTVSAAGFGPCAAIGVADDTGRLIAGIVYYGYDQGTLLMAVAAERPARGSPTRPGTASWATRGNLRALFAYPFAQLGCRRVTALTARRARRTRRFLERLGFVLEGRLRRQFAHDDGMIYGMVCADWQRAGGDVTRIAPRGVRGTRRAVD